MHLSMQLSVFAPIPCFGACLCLPQAGRTGLVVPSTWQIPPHCHARLSSNAATFVMLSTAIGRISTPFLPLELEHLHTEYYIYVFTGHKGGGVWVWLSILSLGTLQWPTHHWHQWLLNAILCISENNKNDSNKIIDYNQYHLPNIYLECCSRYLACIKLFNMLNNHEPGAIIIYRRRHWNTGRLE